MMKQLGITKLRPGRNGSTAPGTPNQANYDEALANPYPRLPEVLTLVNGRKVTDAVGWWKQRRPEIIELFDREVFGRVPKDVPNVTWVVSRTEEFTVGGRPVVGKELVGKVDNASYPAIAVDIQMTVVTPAGAASPVPLMMMFPSSGRSNLYFAKTGLTICSMASLRTCSAEASSLCATAKTSFSTATGLPCLTRSF